MRYRITCKKCGWTEIIFMKIGGYICPECGEHNSYRKPTMPEMPEVGSTDCSMEKGLREKRKEDYDLGWWLSAALEDETGNVAEEFKNVIRKWFDTFKITT